VKNILIIRDNLVKTCRKLKAYYFYWRSVCYWFEMFYKLYFIIEC